MTINQIRDLLVKERIPAKVYLKGLEFNVVKFRVDYRYRDFAKELLEDIRPVGVKFIVSGSLMPWECEFPVIVNVLL